MAREIKQWITVNGNHIPIYDGESKEDAINRFIAKDNEDKKAEQIAKNRKVADQLNGKSKATPVEDSIYTNKPNRQGGRGLSMNEQLDRFESELSATPDQFKALRQYGFGSYANEGKDSKSKLVAKNNLESLIDQNESLHLANAKLFRGGYVDDAEYNALVNGKQTTMLDGMTSWSLREDVAHMYAQGDPYTGEVFGGRKAQGGHRVIFVEQDTDDSLPLPYTYPQYESLRSSRKYKITKVVPESEYHKEKDDGYSARNARFDEPVTYIYVKSDK